jgi:DNA replication protein DnaC
MAKKKKGKKQPYDDRTDLQKIEANWTKVRGLLEREEWSAAIVRAATATEIAANLVVREEFIAKRQLKAELVNHFLRWANGIQGKFDKLILPAVKGKAHDAGFRKLKKRIEDINQQRNSVVHSGSFGNSKDALAIAIEAHAVIKELIKPYDNSFDLKKIK